MGSLQRLRINYEDESRAAHESSFLANEELDKETSSMTSDAAELFHSPSDLYPFEEPKNKGDLLHDWRSNGIYQPTTYPVEEKSTLVSSSWRECFHVCVIVFGCICCLALLITLLLLSVGFYQNYSRLTYIANETVSEDETLVPVHCPGRNGRVVVNDPHVWTEFSANVLKRSRQGKFQDCNEIRLKNNTWTTGYYPLRMKFGTATLKTRVKCDMATLGGGWTVIQSRGNYSNSPSFFNHTWQKYLQGFGDEKGEFWLGLDLIQKLTSRAEQELLVQLWDDLGNIAFARYDRFILRDERNFRLYIGHYSGNMSDALRYSQSEAFSTFDRDNDRNENKTCALELSGGWWFRDCAAANLNGLNEASNRGIFWRGFPNATENAIITRTEMKIRNRRSALRQLEVPEDTVQWTHSHHPQEVTLGALGSHEEDYEDA